MPGTDGTVFDLTATAQVGGYPATDGSQARDAAWATPMETALETFCKVNIEELFPQAEWHGASCRTDQCTVEFSVPLLEDENVFAAALLVVGVGTGYDRETSSEPDGMLRERYTLKMVDKVSGQRRTADEYLELQRSFAERMPDRIEALKRAIRDHQAEAP